MLRIPILLAAWFGLATSTPAQPPEPLRLKGPASKGKQDQSQTQANWWSDRLIGELEELRHEFTDARLAPAVRTSIIRNLDAATEKATALDKALSNRNPSHRALADVEVAVGELNTVVSQHLAGHVTIRHAIGRVNFAVQQLGAAIGSGDNTPDQQKRQIGRLTAGLEEQAEQLRAQNEETFGPKGLASPLDREVRQFARSTQRFNKDYQESGNIDKARKEFAPIGKQWQELSAGLSGVPGLPAQLRYQIHRVDMMTRRLAEALAANINPGGGGGWVFPPRPPLPPVRPPRASILAVGADAGIGPRVVVYSDTKGTVAHSFFAYNRELHRSGVRVAVADLNGDGLPEVVTVNGGRGHCRVKVFDGRDMMPLLTFDGFDQKITEFGYFVAAADLTPDGRALVAVAPDVGGPAAVEVYDLAQGTLVTTLLPFPKKFGGGVRLAWGDVNGDGSPDLITATGPGDIASAVRVFDGSNFTRVLTEFLGVNEKYQGGLFVAAADLTKSNRAEIVVGLDAGSRPLVRVFDGGRGRLIGEFEPFPSTFRGGVRVAIGDPNDTSRLKLICAAGGGLSGTPIKIIGPDGKLLNELNPFPGAPGGSFVGSR